MDPNPAKVSDPCGSGSTTLVEKLIHNFSADIDMIFIPRKLSRRKPMKNSMLPDKYAAEFNKLIIKVTGKILKMFCSSQTVKAQKDSSIHRLT
jgi:Ni2+-binding GTPase involved in maturation of urease and hydrogenase